MNEQFIKAYWKDTLAQDANAMRGYFETDAYVCWHNTNEHFTLEEYLRANCEYPDTWDGEIEQYIECGNHVITATHIFNQSKTLSFHAVTFFTLSEDQKIAVIDEYWGDDGEAPQWRIEKHIGSAIHNL